MKGSGSVIDWKNVIENILKKVPLASDDFKRRRGTTGEAHTKVLDELKSEWRKLKGLPAREKGPIKIDFIGREIPRIGRIEVAIEVDTWNKPEGSWLKLFDVNAKNKIWIYLAREDDKADYQLEVALKEFHDLATDRNESKETCGDIIVFMKTPKRVISQHLFGKS